MRTVTLLVYSYNFSSVIFCLCQAFPLGQHDALFHIHPQQNIELAQLGT